MKRLLMLGGSAQQIPAIEAAKRHGCYVITCDYLPNNPGHALADEYHNVSTTNKEGVLALAQELGIDGIVAYASDPAAPTAAYVSDKLHLPGNPYDSVRILTEKDLFRAFLQENGFTCPKAHGYENYQLAIEHASEFEYPVIVKPVDSSGSKGVVKVLDQTGFAAAAQEAGSYSRSGRVIVERFIQKKGYQVSGDGFTVDGKLVFSSFGNELYSGKGLREYVALGEFWPSLLTEGQLQKVRDELQSILTALHMRTSAYNFEVILDESDTPYVIEIGPRNGGSYIPQLIKYATGVDLVDFTIRAALGEDCSDLAKQPVKSNGFFSNYMLLSPVSGTFDGIWFDEDFKKNNLLEVHCTYNNGDSVTAYRNTSHSLGTILFKTDSLPDMKRLTDNMDKYYRILVK